MKALLICGLAMSVAAGCAAAQGVAAPATSPAVMGPAAPIPSKPISDETRKVLEMLHDRKGTLKDFTADIDYNVEQPRGGATGKIGTMSYIMDPAAGPIFAVDFTDRTVDGNPKNKNHAQTIFDGKVLTIKDWGLNGNSKTFVRETLLHPGDKPGSAVTLRGPLPLPIGIDVNQVMNTFDVTRQESKDPNQVILQLVPHADSDFDYKQLVITVDLKLQLPVTLEETMNDKSITTITLTNIKINDGQAKMLDASTPAAEGWTPKDGGAPGAPAGDQVVIPGK